MPNRKLTTLAVALAALLLPAAASAHAYLLGSTPRAGAVLATPPAEVRLRFSDEIRPAGGERAVDTAGHSVLAGPAHTAVGNNRTLVVPLRPNLSRGDYTVRWRVVSNDGHLEEGVLAFAVGAGSAPPVPTLSAGGGTSIGSVALRLLFLAGVLVAGGAALTGRLLVEPRAQTWAAAAGLALVAGGGFGLLALQPVADATRFGRVTEIAAIAAAAGVAAATLPLLRRFVPLLAAFELAAPTLAGHGLDPRHLRALVALADFAHVVGAAAWIGGLVLLVAARGRRERFPPIALGALALLGVGGIGRAFAAFPTLGSVVHTGYGQAVLVKTGLLAAVLAVAWANRRRIAVSGLRAELVLLAAVVAAVGVLTDLQPPPRTAAAAVFAPAKPAAPPPGAVVLAGEDNDVAVGLAASPHGRDIALRVTALGPDGNGIDGLRVRIAGIDAEPCRAGCYSATVPLPAPPRMIAVSLEGKGAEPATIRFTLPRRWPAPVATALVTRVDRAFRSLRTLVIHEHLASNAHNGIHTVYQVEAPNRFTYDIAGGPKAVVIGGTRWDKLSAGAAWVRSPQEPIRQPEPFWGPDPRLNAHLLSTGRVEVASFYDPRLPAWFVLTIDPRTARLLALRMTAEAHFMQHRYSGFDRPLRIVPPA